MVNDSPFLKMQSWIEKEKELGSAYPNRIVLATSSQDGIPNSRTVAIREITPKGVLFFTQKGTKKVTHLSQNPRASMTLWLAQQQRQVVLDGVVRSLTPKENQHFWDALPREQQFRFSAYAPTSGMPIPSISVLEDKLKELKNKYADGPVPMSSAYCGFHLDAEVISFYTTGFDKFSEVEQYKLSQNHWSQLLISP